MLRRVTAWVLAGGALLLVGEDHPRLSADKAALAPLQDIVGNWRGVGQPKRGSTRGAWIEECECQWQFDDGRARLTLDAPNGKYYQSVELSPGETDGQFVWIGTLPDGESTERFTGRTGEDGRLLVKNDDAGDDRPARITLRLVARGDRLVVLYEKKAPGVDRFTRLAEVGYTRRGGSFARAGGGPECVVTGGYGSMTVEHDGQTYYVCCGGCRDLFLEDPEGVLAEYRQRKAEEQEKE